MKNALDDLNILIHLLEKFELPVSPILQYSIDVLKEKLVADSSENVAESDFELNGSVGMSDSNKTHTISDELYSEVDKTKKTKKTKKCNSSSIVTKRINDTLFRFSYKNMSFSVLNSNNARRVIKASSESTLFRVLSPICYLDQIEDVVQGVEPKDNKIKVDGIWYDFYGNNLSETEADTQMKHTLGAYGSWIIISENTVYKCCENRMLKYGNVYVNKEIGWFWGLEELMYPNKVDRIVVFEKKEYHIQLEVMDINKPTVYTLWLKDLLPLLQQRCKNNKSLYIVFKKEDEGRYLMSLI